MAVDKNKRANKGGKRGKRGKTQDTMARKEWYDVVAPTTFKNRQFTKTICNKTQGTRIAADVIRGRVFEGNLADLNASAGQDDAYRKVRFAVQEVQGRNMLTQFHSMDMTTDRMYSLLRKWCSTIECSVEAKTADGYSLRVFVVAFTTKQKNQLSRNCYAKEHLIKWVRHRVTNMVRKRLAKITINNAVALVTRDILSDALARRCSPIVPLRDLRVTKVKVVRSPKYDAQALLNAHGVIPQSKEADPREVEEATEAPAAPAAAAAAE